MTEITFPQFPNDGRKVVRGIDANGSLTFGQVGVEELSYRGRFGAVATSSTFNAIAIGTHPFTIDDFNGSFKIGDDVLITCLDDPTDCFMWGEVLTLSGSPGNYFLTCYVDDISPLVCESSNWELQVVARPKFGITKDVSTTSMDPTAAGPFTHTVTAGKFFPIGGKLLMIPLAARQIAFVGEVKAYSGTSLVVSKNSTNATVSTSYTAWAIALLDAPQNKLPYYTMVGGRVSVNASDPAHDVDIMPFAVRDYSDTRDLISAVKLTKRLDAAFAAGTNQGAYVQSANLAGTISSAGAVVTGSGTNFVGDMVAAGTLLAKLSDYDDQVSKWTSSPSFSPTGNSIISAGAVATPFAATTDTVGATVAALGAGAGTSYKRGGWVATGADYGLTAVVKDSDGSVEVIATAFTGTGVPDVPTGYSQTIYRVLAYILNNGSELHIVQPLKGIDAPRAVEVPYIDATAFADNVQDALDGHKTGIDGAASRLDLLDALHLAGSTYTPTLTNVTNVAASTASACQYIRVGNVVTVSGRFQVDPTAAAAATELGISLPIASNFSAANQCGGTAASIATGIDAAGISADATNDRATVQWVTSNAANHVMAFTFTYQVI